MILFENNKGEIIKISGNTTIKDLIKMGVSDIKLINSTEPLMDNQWKNKQANKMYKICRKCGNPLFECRSGLVCKNGHGASSIYDFDMAEVENWEEQRKEWSEYHINRLKKACVE